ncbi:hypothetical protein GYMLUDRAFT_35788 [Collybiopsis luxurians FD-317 M1]|nr:hypothetical protein GYMLUDRAFT_35788 [Collybiopsis luxurians FD-317 M1]
MSFPVLEGAEIHPKFIEALSGDSNLYGILWPHIILSASWTTRRFLLHNVNHFFREVALSHPDARYDLGKEKYVKLKNRHHKNPPRPPTLDLDQNWSWKDWSAAKAGFHSFESFEIFCALAAIDPETSHSSRRPLFNDETYLWTSEERDVVLECDRNPMEERKLHANGMLYCGNIGVTGRAEKVIKLFDYLQNNHSFERPSQGSELLKTGTFWMALTQSRFYI